ncbi:hypothetical protein GCM10027446_01510 [Angustibacter peucedani]
MAIIRNPYDVGVGNKPPVQRRGRCSCCSYPIQWMQLPAEPEDIRRLCAECDGHEPVDGESIERRLARAEAHLVCVQALRDAAAADAGKNASEVQESRRKVASALKSRDIWRDMAAAALGEHLPLEGRCDGCASPWPCASIRAAQKVSHGMTHDLLNSVARQSHQLDELERRGGGRSDPDDPGHGVW